MGEPSLDSFIQSDVNELCGARAHILRLTILHHTHSNNGDESARPSHHHHHHHLHQWPFITTLLLDITLSGLAKV